MIGVLLVAVIGATPTPLPERKISEVLTYVLHRETARGAYYRSVVETTTPGKKPKRKEGPTPDAEKCDRFVQKIERELDVRIPCFDYYRLPSMARLSIETGLYAQGITRLEAHAIYSIEACHQHEIVHLAVHQLGSPDVEFHEGIATMLGNAVPNMNRGYAVDLFKKRNMSYQQFHELFSDPGQDSATTGFTYGVADDWMRHLRSRYGMKKLIEFLRNTKESGTKEAFCDMANMTPAESFHLWMYGKKVLVMP